MNDSEGALTDWMNRQYRFSTAAMLRAISATDLVKERPALGQIIRPARGSVLASPEIASYDPNPDYFFHWLRDSAIVIDALRVLIAEQALRSDALGYVTDFIKFSLGLSRLDGPAFLGRGDFRQTVDPAFLVHVRSDDELAQIVGDRALGEVRYNPDGTLDVIKWARPQNDGPALRALALLRFCRLAMRRGRMALIASSIRKRLPRWRDSNSFLRRNTESIVSAPRIALLQWDATPATFITAGVQRRAGSPDIKHGNWTDVFPVLPLNELVEKASVAIFIGKSIPRPDRFLSRDRLF